MNKLHLKVFVAFKEDQMFCECGLCVFNVRLNGSAGSSLIYNYTVISDGYYSVSLRFQLITMRSDTVIHREVRQNLSIYTITAPLLCYDSLWDQKN